MDSQDEGGDVMEGSGSGKGPVDGGPDALEAAPLRDQLLKFSLIVPFQSFEQADLVCSTMILMPERHRKAVHKDIRVNGSNLNICVTAKDYSLMQSTINTLLSQLSVVVRNLQRYWPRETSHRKSNKGG